MSALLFANAITRFLSKAPLRTILTVPFVLQMLATVGLVGYLSYQNERQAVQDLANQLMDSTSDRTQQHLASYTELPQRIVQLVVDDFELGQIRLDAPDLQSLDSYFLKRIQTFDAVSFIYVGNEQGKFIGAGPTQRRGQRSYLVEVTDATTQGQYVSYAIDSQGRRAQVINAVPDYDPRRRPWYQAAVQAGTATWSSIYAFIGEANQGLTITAVKPFYDSSNQLAGVAAVDVYLNDLSLFLKRLRVSQSGQVFIMEPNGLLVASSHDQQTHTEVKGQLNRLPASASSNLLIRSTAQYLETYYGALSQIRQEQRLQFKIQGQDQFIRVTPWRDQFGLNWLIVLVVPESDVMGHIDANIRIVAVLYILAVILAIAISLLTSRWVISPILRLNSAAKALAKGEWQQPIAVERSDQLGELAKSFNLMAEQLQKSFAELQDLNQVIRESEGRLSQILEVLPIGIAVVNQDSSYGYVNQKGQELLGMGPIENLPLSQLAAVYQLYRAGTDQLYPAEQLPLAQALEGKSVSASDLEIRRGAQVIPIEVYTAPVLDKQGQVAYAIATFQDISDRQRAEQLLADYNRTLEQQVQERTLALQQEVNDRQWAEAALREKEHFLQKIADTAPLVLYLFDLTQGTTIYLNQQSVTILGYSPDEIFAGGPQWLRDHFHPEDQHLCDELPERFLTLSEDEVLMTEYRFRHKNGEWRWLNTREVIFTTDASGHPSQILGSVEDITHQKHAEAALRRINLELEHLATQDSLTQLANRRRFDDHLIQEWQRLTREQQPLSLILCDVDYFKAYNDHYGHQKGDECLVQVAQVMSQAIKRPADLVARYGGEEFAVILPNTSTAGAIAVAEAIRLEIQQRQLVHAGSKVSEFLTLSLGIATVIPTPELLPKTLILTADEALYEAKKQGRNNYCVHLVPSALTQI